MTREQGGEPRTPTGSLRRRVIVAMLAVLVMVLAAMTMVVAVVFTRTSERQVRTVLTDRVQLARQLTARGANPTAVLDRVDRRSVRAELELDDGTRLGRVPRADRDQARVVRLSGPRVHGRLVLVPQVALLRAALTRLTWVLVGAGLVAVLVTAVLLVVVVRRALRPLDTMTAVARGIVAGSRGRRLAPTRADTELGRTALAFDEMLDALEGAERQARESEASTRRFVADAAHELRTPIAGMTSVADLLLGEHDLDPARRARLRGLLRDTSGRAGRMVAELLDLTRLDVGGGLEREPVSLVDVVEDSVDRAAVTAGKSEFSVSIQPATVSADRMRLEQILGVLLDNSVQATGGDGRISVEAHVAGQLAVVWVADSGPGIPPGDRERVFERFVRLDEARARRPEGTGLGLAIARGYARAHGGELRCVEPGPDGGARFELTVPLAGTRSEGAELGR